MSMGAAPLAAAQRARLLPSQLFPPDTMEPLLVRADHGGYDVYLFAERFFAVARAAGVVELQALGPDELEARQSMGYIVTGSSLEQVLATLDGPDLAGDLARGPDPLRLLARVAQEI